MKIKIYILSYTDCCNDEVQYYLPTKKAALELVAKEKSRGCNVDNLDLVEFVIEANKAGLCDALNTEVGTGY